MNETAESWRNPVEVDTIRQTLLQITAQQDNWYQGEWAYKIEYETGRCETAFCFAGHVLARAGHTFDWESEEQPEGFALVHTASNVLDQDGLDGTIMIADMAQAELGLTSGQADELFHANNTLVDLWDIAARITDGQIEIPPEVLEDADR